MYIWVYIYMHIYMDIYIYVDIYVSVYIYTYPKTLNPEPPRLGLWPWRHRKPFWLKMLDLGLWPC